MDSGQASSDAAARLRELELVSHALTYDAPLNDVLQLTVDCATSLLGAPLVVLLLENGHGLARVHAGHGLDPELTRRCRIPIDETVIDRLREILVADRPDAMIASPIVLHGRVAGVLAAVRPHSNGVRPEDPPTISVLADLAAIALDTARTTDEARRAVAQHVEATEIRDRAIATLSHDLRSPISAIVSYTELVTSELLGPITEKQRRALERIRVGSQHILALVGNMLELARVDAGEVRFADTEFGAPEVAYEAVMVVQLAAEAKGQEIAILPVVPVRVRGDPDRLRQVLINLLDNAVRYSPAGSRIEIRTDVERRDRNYGVIAITDAGPGIPPELREAIFEPFRRLPDAVAAAPSGAGLGLSIARVFTRRMGGDVEVSSAPGGGSTFTVFLPAAGSFA